MGEKEGWQCPRGATADVMPLIITPNLWYDHLPPHTRDVTLYHSSPVVHSPGISQMRKKPRMWSMRYAVKYWAMCRSRRCHLEG